VLQIKFGRTIHHGTGFVNSALGAARSIGRGETMPAYVIFDVEIRDPTRYQTFMTEVKPALAQAGARYLARGGAHKVYEGDWSPRRIVVLEFPSVAAWETFYNGPVYQGLKQIRDECSSARLVCVEGVEPA
jgi:uncharacterized protein (DUF1330 family)